MKRPLSPSAESSRRLSIAAVTAVLLLYLVPVAGHPPMANPNELVRIELALAMALWASVDLEQPALVYGLSEDVARRDGHVLADKAPGLSLAAVPLVWLASPILPSAPGTELPAYWPLRHLLTATLVASITALLCFFLVARRTGDALESGLPLAVIGSLCTPLWIYGTVFFGHAPAAVLIAAAWVLLLQPRAPGLSPLSAMIGGAAAGLAVTTEYPTLVLVAVLAVTLIVRRPGLRELSGALAGFGLGTLPALLYNRAAFGAPWLTGYAFKADAGFREIHGSGVVGVGPPTLEGLWGVTFSASRGLFYYSPLLVLAPVGLWMMARRSGWRDAAPLTAAIALYVSFAAGFVDWQAGWCAAARHLLPAVPLLVIPTWVAVTAMTRRAWSMAVLTVMVAVGAVRTVLTLAISPFFPPEIEHPLADLVLPGLGDGALAPNLISALTPIPAWAMATAAAGLAAGILIWALIRLAPGAARWVPAVFVAAMLLQLGWLAGVAWEPDPIRDGLRARWLVLVGQGEAARAGGELAPVDLE